MITILSPAKTITLNKKANTKIYTKPAFLEEASSLMEVLEKYTPPELETLMKVSSELAEKTFIAHLNWNKEHDSSTGAQALLAYDGAVYQGISAENFSEEQLVFANDHIRILSGLYGSLRPLDIINPYRLEMATKFKNSEGKNLYSFWKNRLTNYFIDHLDKEKEKVIVNLASKEYSTAINLAKTKAKVITPVFKEYKGRTYKIITIYAKRARGLI